MSSTARLGVPQCVEGSLREVRNTHGAGEGLAHERVTFVGDAAMTDPGAIGAVHTAQRRGTAVTVSSLPECLPVLRSCRDTE